jgi:hypothetical protein
MTASTAATNSPPLILTMLTTGGWHRWERRRRWQLLALTRGQKSGRTDGCRLDEFPVGHGPHSGGHDLIHHITSTVRACTRCGRL